MSWLPEQQLDIDLGWPCCTLNPPAWTAFRLCMFGEEVLGIEFDTVGLVIFAVRKARDCMGLGNCCGEETKNRSKKPQRGNCTTGHIETCMHVPRLDLWRSGD